MCVDTVSKGLVDVCAYAHYMCTCRSASLDQLWGDDFSLVSQYCATCQNMLAPYLLMAKA